MPGGYTGGRPKDASKLSTNPAQIRNRLRRKSKKYTEDIELYSQHAYGKPVQDWDLEELARGKIRNKNGGFTGGRPKWITPAIQSEAKRRLLDETYGLLAGHVDQAVKTMGNLLTSDETDDNGKPLVDARTKFAAAAFIIEHMIGKPKALVEISATEDTRNAIAAAIVLDDGLPQELTHRVIEGSIAEDDEAEEEYGELDDDNE